MTMNKTRSFRPRLRESFVVGTRDAHHIAHAHLLLLTMQPCTTLPRHHISFARLLAYIVYYIVHRSGQNWRYWNNIISHIRLRERYIPVTVACDGRGVYRISPEAIFLRGDVEGRYTPGENILGIRYYDIMYDAMMISHKHSICLFWRFVNTFKSDVRP